jgi:hypothetical protein
MLSLVPKLHDLVGSTASRNAAQLRELGVEPGAGQASIAVVVEPSPSPGRRLLAVTLIDMLLRLDPLVGKVIIDAPGMDENSVASELAIRLPVEVTGTDAKADYVIGVGASTGCDLSVDGAGWLAAIGASAETADDGNPIGPLAGAALATGEAFKWAFASIYPERAALLDLISWNGVFSLFSYAFDRVSPPMQTVRIAATLIGVGGVGAGFLRAIAALGDRLSGSLDLVDADVLTADNLNRVSFATLQGALASTPKVHEAKAYLRRYCPDLTVTDHKETFDLYKRRISRREDRLYDVAVTGLDDDQARWEVQRDLPRILIDGATGKDMVARVERVEFGRYGCLGCSRRPAPVSTQAPVNCDAPPDKYAPSLSFLSSFPGILAAGELIKEASGVRGLQGQYDHIFRYGPNPDLAGTPAIRADCPVSCSKPSKIAQYRRKYPHEDLPGKHRLT